MPTYLQTSFILRLIPVFKKDSKNSKDNYRPISILKNISKVYERILFKQIGTFMDNCFSKFQCGFRIGYSTQQCLLALMEKWKSAVDKGKSFGALLTDLSKAFDCLPHKLLIAKLHSCAFNLNALRLIHSHLPNRRESQSKKSMKAIAHGKKFYLV